MSAGWCGLRQEGEVRWELQSIGSSMGSPRMDRRYRGDFRAADQRSVLKATGARQWPDAFLNGWCEVVVPMGIARGVRPPHPVSVTLVFGWPALMRLRTARVAAFGLQSQLDRMAQQRRAVLRGSACDVESITRCGVQLAAPKKTPSELSSMQCWLTFTIIATPRRTTHNL